MINLLKLLLLILILQSCGSLTLRDSTVCSVSGVIAAGANCGTILSGTKTQLDLDGLIDMLEPTETRGGAAIIPMEDLLHMKVQLEIACQKVRCSKEGKKSLKGLNEVLLFIRRE